MNSENQKILAIRRENKNKWERRVALTPQDCKKLIANGIKVIIQPSELRCFTDKQYIDQGVELNEDITSANVILGVKEVPVEYLYKDKTYMYFSHTLKGQACNMPALKEILFKKIRLIDYELIKNRPDESGNSQRLVAFGRFAGIAGAVDFLQGLGDFLLYKNMFTPFIHTGYSYMFPSVDDAKVSVSKVGNLLRKKQLPVELCPFIIGITSSGRVSKGVQEILRILPHEYIDADDLKSLFIKNPKRDRVFITVIEHRHMYVHLTKDNFDKIDFYQNPGDYKSIFAEKYVPFLSVIFHCMFWDKHAPKILTMDEAHDLTELKKFRVLGISDITCDFKGSIELLQKFTTIENPFYTIDPLTGIIEDNFKKMAENSIIYHAVDHLPAEFPIDASKHFSEKLSPFILDILNSEYPVEIPVIEDDSDLPVEIYNAVETWNGKLMPKFNYLYKELNKYYDEFKTQADNVVERRRSSL